MNIKVFEEVRHLDKGKEYRTARELSKTLGYKDYRNFLKVVDKAKEACRNSGQPVDTNFASFEDLIEIGKGALRKIWNIKLSRYACYLIMQNADPSKDIVAQGQTYFAIQTRKQEVQQASGLTPQQLEDQKRVMLREEIKKHNKELAKTARQVGVTNYAEFTDQGYMGLYGGLRNRDVHKLKGMDEKKSLLDHMSSEELGANLFRATQTEAMIKREEIKGQFQANHAHFEVGQKVRQTIKDLGGTMPEELPAVEHIREAKKRLKSLAYPQTKAGSIAYSPVHVYKLDQKADIDTLQKLTTTIKDHPGMQIVQIGGQIYQVDEEGLEQIDRLLD